MLELRPNCERCARDLPGDCDIALICSFECTFCIDCAAEHLQYKCPNCSGELVARPRRANPKRLQPEVSTQEPGTGSKQAQGDQ